MLRPASDRKIECSRTFSKIVYGDWKYSNFFCSLITMNISFSFFLKVWYEAFEFWWSFKCCRWKVVEICIQNNNEYFFLIFLIIQVSGNLVAFEDANNKETSKSDYRGHLGVSINHYIALGDVFPTCADISWAARHRNVLGAMARPFRRNTVLLVR